MHRASRNNALCLKSLEQALERNPETYRHINLIAFGFPCQDISNANPKGKGLKGERSSLFFEAMRIVNILNPTWLLIENVPRLLSINGGRDFAIVLQTLSESGYGYAWRILDSQYFGVAQRRRRVFIVGCFGRECPPEILFEHKSSGGDDKKVKKMGRRGLCISTKYGERQDPTAESLIASTIGKQVKIAPCLSAHETAGSIEAEGRIRHLVAQTLGATPRGNVSFIWQDTHIAEINSDGKRKIARVSKGLDSVRGIVIGNAVTVQVAEWIGKRIIQYVL